MRWTERQRAMLREMGVRVWSPAVPADTAETNADTTGDSTAAAATAATAATTTTTTTVARADVRADARADVAALGWPELRAAVAGCTACALCERRTQTVFGVGHERAHWMVVGEAPGEHEDRQGEPFVGKSGQLLDNMLRAVGLARNEGPAETRVYIANAVKCRPPGNRNPAPEELAACEGFLIRQVQLVQPKIILAMGRFAVQSLLRSTEPIGRLRGKVHRYRGVPLIVTYHPAYLLRNLDEKARAWDDLCLAVETLRAGAGAGPALGAARSDV